jgi:5-methylcytosine-specific restriction endonuclease McrA
MHRDVSENAVVGQLPGRSKCGSNRSIPSPYSYCGRRRPTTGQITLKKMPTSRSRRARAAKRRKRRMAAVDNDLNDQQWTALKDAWGGCAYCGATSKTLQRDCVLALSRGGRYTLENIVPACGSCNTSKCNDEVTGWLRRKRLNEASFLLRYIQIKTTLTIRFSHESPANSQ